jgi:hypothetical protein
VNERPSVGGKTSAAPSASPRHSLHHVTGAAAVEILVAGGERAALVTFLDAAQGAHGEQAGQRQQHEDDDKDPADAFRYPGGALEIHVLGHRIVPVGPFVEGIGCRCPLCCHI